MTIPVQTALRILLVEDNPADADLVQEALAATNPRVDILHVELISDALERAAGGDRDVVLLDLNLPDAYELGGFRRFREAFPDLPVVVLTGASDERLGARAVAEGAQDYLAKGSDAQVLLRTLRYAVERQQYSERARLLAEERAAHAIAERERSKAQLLSEASKLLFASFDCGAALASLAQLLVPQLGSWCAIAIDDGADRRLAASAHEDPAKADLVRRLWEPRAVAPSATGALDAAAAGILDAAMRSEEPQLYAEITDESRLEWVKGAEHAGIVRELGLRSAMVVPLRARGGVLGAIFLASSGSLRYGPEDLSLAEEIGRRAGTAADSARLYDAAQQAIHLRDEFLSIASHELRTPLTALHLQLQSAQRRLPAAPADASQRIQSAIRASCRLGDLIETLLDVSRITTGRFTIAREHVDAAAVLRDIVEHFRESARHAKCELTVHADEPTRGDWDQLRLGQAVGNLLSNAIKYAAGKPIDVRVEREDGHLVVAVCDQGPGIPEADLPRIFERFERGFSVRHYGGLGLGLYVTRQIAEAHGGRLEAANRPEGGARFTLRLPLEAPAAARS